MDAIGIGGLVLSAVGVLLSIWALVRADSAKRAVDKVIKKSSDQVARDAARDLLVLLVDARDAAMGRRQGASRLSSAGRSVTRDLRALELAQNALATSTVGSDWHLVDSLRAAAKELELARVAIASDSDRDGWADALGVLQGVIPRIDGLHQELGTRSLR